MSNILPIRATIYNRPKFMSVLHKAGLVSKKIKASMMKSPMWVYHGCMMGILKRTPATDTVVAHAYPQVALFYARVVIDGPFPEAEPMLAQSSDAAIGYATTVLKGPFPAGEDAIASDPERAPWYARHILKIPNPSLWRKGLRDILAPAKRGFYDRG